MHALTTKLVGLLTKEKCIEVNQAAEVMKVKKRRIYDISNVLEGIGLVDRPTKNKIRWIGGNIPILKKKVESDNLDSMIK